jgi:hypothetical protein
MTVNNFWKQHKSTKFDMGFRMVYKLLYTDEKKIWSIFTISGTLTKEKSKKNII